MQKQTGIQSSTFDGGLDDLESFQAWAEEIKTNMSQANPSLYEVLGEIASSKQPIEEGDIIQASQRIMKEKQRALRVPQAKTERASFKEEEAHQLQPIDEHRSTEADKLQRRNEGRQLGCLLVQKTKGGDPASSHKMAFSNKWLGSLEATQLEHPLQASSKPHERRL